jgi:ketosteroid isomerase-like protein
VDPPSLDIVRRQWEAWNELDLDGVADLWHADVVWDNTHSERAHGTFRGKAEVLDFLGRYLGAWEGYRLQAESFEAEGPFVLSNVRHAGVPPGETEPIAEDFSILYTVRDGLVTRIEVLLTREDGAEALRSARGADAARER